MNQYLTELARVLARKDIKSAPIENGRLPILQKFGEWFGEWCGIIIKGFAFGLKSK